MLEDTNEHFVICRVSGEAVDTDCAENLALQFRNTSGESFDADVFVEQYAVMCGVWSNDLRSLEQCTMTGPQFTAA
jgi:hypothetical protein